MGCPAHPQQAHLDLRVDDLDVAEAAVIALGATRHEVQPDLTFRVFLDPAGHPCCLCLPGGAGRPGRADELPGQDDGLGGA